MDQHAESLKAVDTQKTTLKGEEIANAGARKTSSSAL